MVDAKEMKKYFVQMGTILFAVRVLILCIQMGRTQ